MLVLAILPCVVVQFGLLIAMQFGRRADFADFANFYVAGRIADSGRSAQLYDMELQQRIESFLPPRSGPGGFLPYVHAPFFALLMMPLAHFSYPTAYTLWWSCNFCFFWLALFTLGQISGESPQNPYRIFCAGVLFLPVYVTFVQGQDALFTLLMVSVAYFFLTANRELLAGAAIGMIAQKPQLAIMVLGLMLLTRKNWIRLLAGFVLSGLAQSVVAAAILGWRVVIDYPAFLMNYAGKVEGARSNVNAMPNLRGMLHTLLGDRLPVTVLNALLALLTVLLLAIVIWTLRSKPARAHRQELRFSALIATAFIAAYYGFFHDMTLLLVALLLAWRWLEDSGLGSLQQKLLAGFVGAQFALGLPLLKLAGQYALPLMGFLVLCLVVVQLTCLRSPAAQAGSERELSTAVV